MMSLIVPDSPEAGSWSNGCSRVGTQPLCIPEARSWSNGFSRVWPPQHSRRTRLKALLQLRAPGLVTCPASLGPRKFTAK